MLMFGSFVFGFMFGGVECPLFKTLWEDYCIFGGLVFGCMFRGVEMGVFNFDFRCIYMS